MKITRTLNNQVVTALAYLVILLFTSAVPAIAKDHDNEPLLKAVFIYNIAKFTRWPETSWSEPDTTLKLCTYGQNPVTSSLFQLSGRRLQNRTLAIHGLDNINELENCQLLYIADTGNIRPNEIIKNLCCTPVLTISELPGFTKSGGMIEIYVKEGKIRFKVNLGNVRNSKLDINSRLLSLSEIVAP